MLESSAIEQPRPNHQFPPTGYVLHEDPCWRDKGWLAGWSTRTVLAVGAAGESGDSCSAKALSAFQVGGGMRRRRMLLPFHL